MRKDAELLARAYGVAVELVTFLLRSPEEVVWRHWIRFARISSRNSPIYSMQKLN